MPCCPKNLAKIYTKKEKEIISTVTIKKGQLALELFNNLPPYAFVAVSCLNPKRCS